MSSDGHEQATGIGDNQSKLAGLQSGQAEGTDLEPQGPLPWEAHPASPSQPKQTSSTPDRDVRAFTPGVTQAQESYAEQPVVVAHAGMYTDGHGVMRRWTGSAWDPRPLGGVWPRIGCWIVDNVLSSIVGILAAMALSIPLLLLFGEESPVVIPSTFVGLTVGVLGYFAVNYHLWGTTPGMRLGRLRVVDIVTGGNLSWSRAWLRSLVLSLAFLTGIIAIIWVSITAGNPAKKGPHDSAAGSVVLRAVS